MSIVLISQYISREFARWSMVRLHYYYILMWCTATVRPVSSYSDLFNNHRLNNL